MKEMSIVWIISRLSLAPIWNEILSLILPFDEFSLNRTCICGTFHPHRNDLTLRRYFLASFATYALSFYSSTSSTRFQEYVGRVSPNYLSFTAA